MTLQDRILREVDRELRETLPTKLSKFVGIADRLRELPAYQEEWPTEAEIEPWLALLRGSVTMFGSPEDAAVAVGIRRASNLIRRRLLYGPSAMVHELKCWPEVFQAVYDGVKSYEIRSSKDRVFFVGDTLHLREYLPHLDYFTNRWASKRVTYLTPGGQFGLPDEMVVMAIV